MKRFLAFALFIGMLVSGLSPAQAAGAYSPVTDQTSARSYFKVYPLNDTASVEMWTTMDGDGWQVLHTAKMNADGTFSPDKVLESLPRTTYRIQPGKNWAVLLDGTLAVTWATISYDNVLNGWRSVINVAYTSDGENWSIPVQPFDPVFITDQGLCEMWLCGYQWPHLDVDASGRIAIGTLVIDTASKVLLKTSRDGVTWSSSASIPMPSGSRPNLWDLKAAPGGGFVAIFSRADSDLPDFTALYSTYLSAGVNSSWSSPAFKASFRYGLAGPQLVQTGTNQLSLVVFSSDGSFEVETARLLFDPVLGIFPGRFETLDTVPNSYVNAQNNLATASSGKVFAYATAVSANGAQFSRLRLMVFKDGVAQPIVNLPNSTDQNTQIMGVHMNGNGSISVAWSGYLTPPTLATYKDGVLVSSETIPMGMTAGNSNAVFSKGGNLFTVLDYWDSGLQQQINKSIVYQGATLPQASKVPAILGKAKVGSTLKTALPTFTSPVTGIGITKVQWYSCSVAIPTATNSIPQTCVPITGATKKTTKLTSKLKKKFVTVVISNQNSLGTTTLVAKSSGKVK